MALFKDMLAITGFAGLFAHLLKTGVAISVCTLLACSGDSSSGSSDDEHDSDDVSVAETEITGVTQKGPFLMGSKVQMFEISNGRSLNQTGKSFNGKISNDKGEFKINGSKLVSQYVILEASGYYRNENTGKNSNSELTLLAISDVKDRNTININLLTHLEYERVNYLVTEKKFKVEEAKKQAQKEILEIFDIDNTNFSNSEDLNIAGASDEDGALLAISILLQGDRSESQLSELLTKIAIDMEDDGEWNDETKRNEIADWAAEIVQSGRIATIRENIEKWKLSSVVPNFEKYINDFWWKNYGLATCDKDHKDKILQNANKQSQKYQAYYICKDGSWKEASTLEFDTYQWTAGKDGVSKYGSVNTKNCYVFEDKAWRSGNTSDCSLGLRGCTALRQDTVGKGSDKVYHICDKKSWRNATTYEKDTFGWKNSTDGSIKKGNVTDTVYVFDKTTWRVTNNVESKLGGCVRAIADSVGKVGSTYYICKSNKWVEASAIEYDTYRWTAGKDGEIKNGSVNTKNCYVFEDKVWRSGNTSDCSLGLRGCTALRQDTVGKGNDKVYHICDKKSWRNATTYEKDTFGWKNSTDGSIKKGNVTDTVYVFDKTTWRAASNVESKLGGCVNAIADSVGKVSLTYYICKTNKWVEASAVEYDTYRWVAKNNGEVRAGQVNKNIYYIYESSKKAWRNATTLEKDTYKQECSKFGQIVHGNVNVDYAYFCYDKDWKRFFGNESVVYGKLVDNRDGHIYRTVKIGNQTWMAENLNYADSVKYSSMKGGNWCSTDTDSCNIYGRYYNKAAAIDSAYWHTIYPDREKVQGICPNGWHIPSSGEMSSLYQSMDNDYKNMQAKGFKNWEQATDKYGFSALPIGSYDFEKIFVNFHADYVSNAGDGAYYCLGLIAQFWTSSMWEKYYDEDGGGSIFWTLGDPKISKNECFMSVSEDAVNLYYSLGTYDHFGLSVRCVKDDEE